MTGEKLVAHDVGKLPRDVENAISVIEFEIKRKRKDMSGVLAKTEPSENERVKVGRELEFIANIERLVKAFRNTFHANLGRVPPCDLDLERDILGALMLHSKDGEDSALGRGIGAPAITQVQSFLLPDHFYMEAHIVIYTAILDLYRNGAPVDMITVKNHLRKAGQLELVGGAHYLAVCTTGVSSAASIDYWGRVVVEFAMKRELILACSEVCRNAYDDTHDAFELLDVLEDMLKRAKGWIKQ